MAMKYSFPATDNQAINDLGHQYEKIIQKANRGAIKTRYRYAEAGARFVKWVQPAFRMQKLQNLQDKHILAYGKYLQNKGCSDKYIKNEISALQYIHSYVPNTRYELSDSKVLNREIGLQSTPNYKAATLDQSWTKDELSRFCDHTRDHNHKEYGQMAQITYNVGTRLEEIATLRRHEVENGLRTGILHLHNTKGGRPRDVPLSGEARRLFTEAIQEVPRGGYVFVPEGVKIHSFIQSAKDYLYRHRDEFQDPSRKDDPARTELHFHGLRHSFAQNHYVKLRNSGLDDREARREVSEALGHSRESITFTYV